MSASAEQSAARQATKVAAVALRRDGHSTAEVAKILGKSARYIRAAVQGEDLSPPPADAATPAKRKARRKAPRSFARRNQPTGSMLHPILLEAAPRGGLGGFGVAPVEVSAAGLGPSVPIGGHDERGRVKLSEQVIDLGTTSEHDARRYKADHARNDESWEDLPDWPEGARSMVVIREDGSREEFSPDQL
jgi:hypothetical protein